MESTHEFTHEFTHLFEPLRIGPVVAKNRVEIAPAEPFLATRDGEVTADFLAFTENLAKSGAAIVTVGDSPVTQSYADINHYVLNLADPLCVTGLFRIAEVIHRWNALASIELNLRDDRLPADYSVQEVREIINAFAEAAARCRAAGFDMVMLHGGHGHSVSQFYSRHFNKRTDNFGSQNPENRCRFSLELVAAVREAIGPNMALEYRFSGDEMLDSEINTGLDEAIEFARVLAQHVDLLHVSAGSMYDPRTVRYTIPNSSMPRPTNKHLAAAIRPHVNVPVVSVGSYTPVLAEEALREGAADMIAMLRPFVADPLLLHKTAQGNVDLVRPCRRCNRCTGEDPHGAPTPLRCSVNPVAGREAAYDNHIPQNAGNGKRVSIVRGGHAGLELARQLARYGCAVTYLYDETFFAELAGCSAERKDEFADELAANQSAVAANPDIWPIAQTDVEQYLQWSLRSILAHPQINLVPFTNEAAAALAADNTASTSSTVFINRDEASSLGFESSLCNLRFINEVMRVPKRGGNLAAEIEAGYFTAINYLEDCIS